MKRRSRTLANYVGAGSLYLVLIQLFLMGIWGTWIFRKTIMQSTASANVLSAQAVAGRLEEFLARQGQVLDGIASMLERPDLYPRDKLNEYLATSLSIYPFLDQIEILDPKGRIAWMAPYDSGYAGISRAGEDVYESVKAAERIGWSSSYISLKHNAPAVSFGERIGEYVLLCDLNLSSILRFSTSDKPRGSYEISITDRNGVLLSNADVSKIRRREYLPGFAEIREKAESSDSFEISANGRPVLVSVSRIRAPSWYVLILYDSSNIDLMLRSNTLSFIGILVFSASMGFLVSRYRIRKVDRALKHLASKAALISKGKYDEFVHFGEGFVEFERVGENFNGMVVGVRDREAVLIDKERGFRQILENIRLFAIGVNLDGRISFANPCFLEATGYSLPELVGREISTIVAPEESSEGSPFDRLIAGGYPGSTCECRIIPKEGARLLVEWTVTAGHDAAGAISGATGIGADITEKRRQSERLESSLLEKDILLKEVHHRVKNNMQLISSLLSLQKQEAKGGTADLQLENAQNRIRSISLVHEMLYESDNFGAIDFGGYASALTREILQGREGKEIELEADIGSIGIALDEAVPCGLILNEALTNIRKYAFPPRWTGAPVVELALTRNEAGRVVLRVKDNGVGLPPGCDPATSGTLGMTIMRLLALQASAELSVSSDRGTKVELTLAAIKGKPG